MSYYHLYWGLHDIVPCHILLLFIVVLIIYSFALINNEPSFKLQKDGISGGYDNPGLRLRHATSAPFDQSMPSYSGGTSSYYPDSAPNSSSHAPLTPLDIQRMESAEGTQRQYQLIPDQDYLRQRADAMTQVESNIVELGTIFNKLAVMVNEHREMVQRVEDNVDDTHANVNLSLATLTDTFQNLQTNRALGMKVLGIFVLFIIMFIIFFA